MMGRLDGRVAMVTGAARGQGRSHAVTLAEEGADILAVDVCDQIGTIPYQLSTASDLQQTVKEIEAVGRRVVAATCDVRSGDDLARAVNLAHDGLGEIDILVANAGVWGLGPLWELSDRQWQDMIDVNLTGAWRTLKAVVPDMMRRRRGAIVLVSSVNGLEAGPGFAHYTAAKHGVVGLMKTASIELGVYGIRCNALCPGIVDTKMNDWQGCYDMMAGHPGGTPQDRRMGGYSWSAIAGHGLLPPAATSKAISWLVSDDAAEVTGICLPVDAGHVALPGWNAAPVLD